MTETESTALMEKEPAQAVVLPPVEAAAAPAPEESPSSLESTLRRLEEQSALRTELAKKRLFWGRLGSVFLGVTMAVVVYAALTLMPQVEAALDTAGTVMDNLTLLSRQLQEADIPAILDNLDQTLLQGRASLTDISEAVRSISSIDFAGLNQAILDLQKLARNPLGSLLGLG